MVVPFDRIIAHNDPSNRDIRVMKDVLNRQGQIEPLQVRVYHPAIYDTDSNGEEFMLSGARYITCEEDVWGPAIVHAARHLGWPTLLICVVDKYQQ
jgi:hypothetical protein